MNIICHVYDQINKNILLYIQIHIVQTTVNKYVITW